MERETTDKRTEKTKASILQALISLSKKKEINEISIRELTEAAHIQKYFLSSLHRCVFRAV